MDNILLWWPPSTNSLKISQRLPKKNPRPRKQRKLATSRTLIFCHSRWKCLAAFTPEQYRMNAINIPTLFLIWQFFIVHSCWKKVVDPTQKLSSLNIPNKRYVKDFVSWKHIFFSEKNNFATTQGTESPIFQPDINQKVSFTRHNIKGVSCPNLP